MLGLSFLTSDCNLYHNCTETGPLEGLIIRLEMVCSSVVECVPTVLKALGAGFSSTSSGVILGTCDCQVLWLVCSLPFWIITPFGVTYNFGSFYLKITYFLYFFHIELFTSSYFKK